MTRRQIIAMGGGGFSMEPENLALDRYVLDQSPADRPRICFLPTATGDSENYLLRFYRAFVSLNAVPSHLSLFQPSTVDLRAFLLEKDIIYVGGGNTRSMLALWREWQVDQVLREAYEAGIILAGISAGANCWFEQCSTDSMPGALNMWPCLGFLPGSFTPHYDGEVERRPSLHRLLLGEEMIGGWAADDGAALHFVDEGLAAAVSSRPAARAYRVTVQNGEVREIPEPMTILTPP